MCSVLRGPPLTRVRATHKQNTRAQGAQTRLRQVPGGGGRKTACGLPRGAVRGLTAPKGPRGPVTFSDSHKSTIGSGRKEGHPPARLPRRLRLSHRCRLRCPLPWGAFSTTPQTERTTGPRPLRVVPSPALSCVVIKPFQESVSSWSSRTGSYYVCVCSQLETRSWYKAGAEQTFVE